MLTHRVKQVRSCTINVATEESNISNAGLLEKLESSYSSMLFKQFFQLLFCSSGSINEIKQ